MLRVKLLVKVIEPVDQTGWLLGALEKVLLDLVSVGEQISMILVWVVSCCKRGGSAVNLRLVR